MLTTHGFPKSGNHALVKACQLLGVPCDVDHRPHAAGLPAGTTRSVFIVRDPRNVIVSKLREDGQPVTPGMFLARWRRFTDRPLREELADYAGWLTDPRVYRVTFEGLTTDLHVIQHLAGYLGVPYQPGAFEALPGLTRTWRAVHADYRAIWTPEVAAAWDAEGGPALLATWGYR